MLRFPVMAPGLITVQVLVMGRVQDLAPDLDTGPVQDMDQILVTDPDRDITPARVTVQVTVQIRVRNRVRVQAQGTTVHGGGPGQIAHMVRKELVKSKITLLSAGQP
ncbi:MAG TPA: hypothetical protein DEF34_05720 [Desulfotomaculum sp.]|nr:MAG: hypothetical protein VR67_07020 [Peptococcaceae bacterium BRH_c8a]KJS73582.1 MAG: hypothetical protein JL56_10855 [Desulfotomaculum sp. BICA1-6]HBX23113.1 hypothetical protein [Desulfotomaculum sp.]